MHYGYECCVYKKYLLIVPIPFLFCILMIFQSLRRVRKVILKLKSFLISELDMKVLGFSKNILRIEIHHDRGVGKLWLSQKAILRMNQRGLPCLLQNFLVQYLQYISNCPHSYVIVKMRSTHSIPKCHKQMQLLSHVLNIVH